MAMANMPMPMSGTEADLNRRSLQVRQDSGRSRRSDTSRHKDLYELCEATLTSTDSTKEDGNTLAVSRSFSASSNTDGLNEPTVNQLWGPVRNWLAQNTSLEERRPSALRRGAFATTALHLVAQHKYPPMDIISALISAAPETASWPDSNGWLPIHFASAKGTSLEVIKVLANAFPEGLIEQDRRMRTPLHFAFFGDENNKYEDEESMKEMTDIVRFLSDPPSVAKIPDEKGRLAFHFAVAYGTCEPILRILYDAYPDSIHAKENMGRNALHIAMANPCEDSPQVLKFLLEHMNQEVITETDNEDTSPIQLLSSRASKLKKSNSEERHIRKNIIECLEQYLNAKPQSSADLLVALQSLPEWLRDTAVVNPHVQDILNKKIAQRFPTSILLLDLYLHIIIIICFQMASRAHIDFRFTGKDLPGYTNVTIIICFIGTTYFLCRKIAHFVSTMNLGSFRSWLFDLANWFDIAVVSLLYFYCVQMKQRELKDDEIALSEDYNFRTGVAITGATLWITGVSFLKSTMLDFAVFFKSVQDITRHLFIFMLSLLVILVAFAEAFVIIFRETEVCQSRCREEYNTFPHCTFLASLLKVYTMMMGEIGDVNRYQGKHMAQFLYCFFAFLVVILLSNVLIAIVGERHSVIQNEHAEMVFWSNRLQFVAEMDAIISITRSDGKKHSYKQPSGQNDQISPSDNMYRKDAAGEQRRDLFRIGWNELIEFLKEEPVEDLNLVEIYLSLFLRFATVTIIIPLWLALGLGTVGILWPPQVREWLFIQRGSRAPRSDTGMGHEEKAEKMVLDELDTLRDHVEKTKLLQMNVSKELLQMKDALESLLPT